MGRCVSGSRAHSTWPVLASASTAPLARTPAGAPAVSITGPAGRDGDGRGRARPRVAIAMECPAAARGAWPAAVSAHAPAPQARTAATVSATIGALSRITLAATGSSGASFPW